MENPPREATDPRAPRPMHAVVHNWERALGIAALVALLMFGAIFGVDQLMGLFPS